MSKEKQEFLMFLDEFIKKTKETCPASIDSTKIEKVEKVLRALGNGIASVVDEVEPDVVGASLLYFGAVLMKGCLQVNQEDSESDVIEQVTGVRI